MSCEKCGGYGFVQDDNGPMGIPQAVPCSCRIDKEVNEQAERCWQNLSSVTPKKRTPLKSVLNKDAIVVADKSTLAVHLRSALWIARYPNRFVKVVNDATLMSAWLSNLSRADSEIYDPDFKRDIRAATLEDLAESPSLLIVRLGIKMARNSAMPEVLTETIELRGHLNKPTWLVVEPDKPLEEGHLAWSRSVDDAIDGWNKVALVKVQSRSTESKKTEQQAKGKKRFSL